MEAKSLVSVIVPIYNVEKYLNCCLDSVIGQTYSNLEILLIDDGSTDKSGKIADFYAEKDGRIHVFHTENRGVSHARNIGLDNMKGEYCILLDSDDALRRDTIEQAVSLLEKEQLDCVIYKYQTIADETFDKQMQECGTLHENCKFQYIDHDDVMREILTGQRFRMLACNKLYTASLWENIRYPVGRKFGDDTFVTYKLMDKCRRLAYIENVLYFYRMREGSSLHSKVSEENLQLFLSYSEMLQYYQKHLAGLLEEAYYAYIVRIFDFFAKVKHSDVTSKEKNRLLKGLRRISYPFRRELCACSKATRMQKILLFIFFLPGKTSKKV